LWISAALFGQMIALVRCARPREGNSKEGRNKMATKKQAKPIKGAKKLGNVKPLQRHKFAKLGPVSVLSNKNPFKV
jgi:hypothetical protein